MLERLNFGVHGDVLIIREDIEIDETFRKIPRRQVGSILRNDVILAEGEVTGHAHRIKIEESEADLFERDGIIRLRVLEKVDLTHEEHHNGPITYGVYRFPIQREYDPTNKMVRKVFD